MKMVKMGGVLVHRFRLSHLDFYDSMHMAKVSETKFKLLTGSIHDIFDKNIQKQFTTTMTLL